MASRSRVPTSITRASNTVLLVGGGAGLVEATKYAALSTSGAHLMQATVANAATIATQHRPFAIVVPRDIYEFSGPEFDALAKDISAELVVVPESVKIPLLTALLTEAAVRLG